MTSEVGSAVGEPRLERMLPNLAIFFESLFSVAFIPLIPHLAHELRFSVGQAGVVGGSYATGVLIGTVPSALVIRRVPPRLMVPSGLFLIALGLLGVGFASDALWLAISRILEGIGASVAWAGALSIAVIADGGEGQNSRLGKVFVASFTGALLGPVVSWIASSVGVRAVFFCGAGLVIVAAVIASVVAGSSNQTELVMSNALRRDRLNVMLLPLSVLLGLGFVSGAVEVIGPLLLSADHIGTRVIAVVFSFGYGIQLLSGPVAARIAERRGPPFVLMTGLIVFTVITGLLGIAALHSVALELVGASLAFSLVMMAPATGVLSSASRYCGMNEGVAMALVTGIWCCGFIAGSAGLAQVANASSEEVAFLGAALFSAGLYVLVRRGAQRLTGSFSEA
jgi:predicted MFS family arabinose efflux permease